MTRPKYDYEQLILMPQFKAIQQASLTSIAYETRAEEFAVYEADLRAFRQQDRAKAGKWVSWTHGAALTHNPDGSHSPELQNWLKVNEKLIEIGGYAEVGEAISVWNPQVESWIFDQRGDFKFSPAYWEYLLSEGYVERWIECHETRLAGKFGVLSNSLPSEYVQQRIMQTEIPHPDRHDHLGYDPLKGLMSERRIYQFQKDAGANPVRSNKALISLEI
jgi:hypothetical protein